MQKSQNLNNTTFYNIALAVIILARLFLNALIPVMDQTEARYSEIARIMAETGNWVTPQIDYGVPFWAKPPLSTWLSAMSIKIFGVNEFAVRFPSFIIAILLLLLLKPFVRKLNVPLVIPAFILFTVPEFLLHVGVVSTDMTLLLSLTLLMVSFWQTMNDQKKWWKYLFFVAIGLGFLAKGPIILVLAGPPIFVWTVCFKNFKKVIFSFPWVVGFLIVFVIAFPWYYFAEKSTPGFLEYFFVGEHYKRFFDSTWNGDKYGFPKIQPFGIIWVFLYTFSLPWIIFLTYKIITLRKEILKDKWLFFLLVWIFWTPLFFTSSKSLIHTYVLPTSFPLALFVATFWNEIKNKKTYVYTALILPGVSIIIIILSIIPGVFENNTNTDKYILKNHHAKKLFYAGEKTYSSQFYSRGKVISVSPEKLDSINLTQKSYDLLIRKRDSNALKPFKNFVIIGESKKSMMLKNKP